MTQNNYLIMDANAKLIEQNSRLIVENEKVGNKIINMEKNVLSELIGLGLNVTSVGTILEGGFNIISKGGTEYSRRTK